MAKSAKAKRPMTRYERVREILDEAAGPANYQGHEKFWHLPLDEFLEVEFFGIRMIAPGNADTKAYGSCDCPAERTVVKVEGGRCSSPFEAPAEEREAGVALAEEPSEGRGAASALIKGLRGEAPFDGTRFPRLPWGGQAVAGEDIRFIEEWIDDGCPDDDRAVDITLKEPSAQDDQARGEKEESGEIFHIYSLPTGEYKYTSGELKQRVNLECLDERQVEKLRYAHRKLFDLNDYPQDRRNYNNLALIHQNHCQHAWERFLPWHRVYLYEFEQALQDFVPDITLPYWDWPMPIYKEGVYQLGKPGAYDTWGGQLPEAYRAFLTHQSIKNLEKKHPREDWNKLDPIVCKTYTSQQLFFFAVSDLIGKRKAKRYRNDLIYELLQTNALWYPLRYPAEFWSETPVDDPEEVRKRLQTINEQIHYHYPTAPEVSQIQALNNFRDYGGGSVYNDSYGYIDQNPHNTLHIWSGGSNPDFDPSAKGVKKGIQVVREYHTKSDLYSQPQFGDMFSNLTASFDPIFWPHHVNVDRLWSEWQVEHPSSVPSELDTALSPWNYTVKDVLDIYKFGYEYVKGCYIFAVDEAWPVSRFVSERAGIPKRVLKNHRKAELRLHRVPQLPLSCYIRAYLNLPEADATTRVRDNDHYAGYAAVFGHGPCYGGPGHCDVPKSDPHRVDLRGRSMNVPRNYRIDITECVKRLVENGASDLQVTLVVVGVDGQEIPDLLRLAGVSFNFKD